MTTLKLDENANLELEGNVIGAMILDNKFFVQAQDRGLQPTDFTDLAFQKTYEILIEKQGIDIISLQDLHLSHNPSGILFLSFSFIFLSFLLNHSILDIFYIIHQQCR